MIRKINDSSNSSGAHLRTFPFSSCFNNDDVNFALNRCLNKYVAFKGFIPISHYEIFNFHLANILNFAPGWSAGYSLNSHLMCLRSIICEWIWFKDCSLPASHCHLANTDLPVFYVYFLYIKSWLRGKTRYKLSGCKRKNTYHQN